MKNKNYIEILITEIKDYFNSKEDEDYLAFDSHPLSSIDDIMDPHKPAPWDHLTNHENDHDIDVEIEEFTEK